MSGYLGAVGVIVSVSASLATLADFVIKAIDRRKAKREAKASDSPVPISAMIVAVPVCRPPDLLR